MNEEKVINVAAKDAYGEVDPKAFKDFLFHHCLKG